MQRLAPVRPECYIAYMRSIASHLGADHTPVSPAGVGRWAVLLVLIAAVPASVVGAVATYSGGGAGRLPGAVAVAVAPILLGFLGGRWAWPRDEDRWAATIRLTIACGTLWIAGFVTTPFYFSTLCSSQVITPALVAGAAVYAATALATVRDGDFAFLTWPVAVIAGLAVILVITAAGPHGVCYT